jgi:hypothetical protein
MVWLAPKVLAEVVRAAPVDAGPTGPVIPEYPESPQDPVCLEVRVRRLALEALQGSKAQNGNVCHGKRLAKN